MKKVSYILVLTTILLSCGQKRSEQMNTVSNTENMNDSVANSLNVDVEVINAIKKYSDSTIYVAEPPGDAELSFEDSTKYDEFILKKISGVSFKTKSEGSIEIVRKLQTDLSGKGYLVFLSEQNFGYNPDIITVLRTSDQFDAIRFQGTNGINYDIYCENVIENLQGYDSKYGIEIESAGFDFVQVRLKKLPANMTDFANEVYQFCPDVVDQGTETVEALKDEIANTQTLYYWWD